MERDLIKTILARENMDAAWEDVRANKGNPGIDGVTLARWNRNWEANIERLRNQVRANLYKPRPPRRIRVPKKGGGLRELSMLTVSDKVMQRATLNVVDNIFERRFLKNSHGYRRGRSVATAVQQVLQHRDHGKTWVLDADIAACFDSIDHAILMGYVRRVIADPFVLNLMELWLRVGRKLRRRATGIPPGSVIAPLWCNIYLHQLDAYLSTEDWKMVRYADDFVLMTASQKQTQLAKQVTEERLSRLNLALHPEKTRIVSFQQGFSFLGVNFLNDSYSYEHQSKRVEVTGRSVKMLWRHPPHFYD